MGRTLTALGGIFQGQVIGKAPKLTRENDTVSWRPGIPSIRGTLFMPPVLEMTVFAHAFLRRSQPAK